MTKVKRGQIGEIVTAGTLGQDRGLGVGIAKRGTGVGTGKEIGTIGTVGIGRGVGREEMEGDDHDRVAIETRSIPGRAEAPGVKTEIETGHLGRRNSRKIMVSGW